MGEAWQERWRRKHGDFAVPCVVSGRWLEFSQGGPVRIGEGEALTISVMTEASGERPRKICELIVTREDLIDVLALTEKPKDDSAPS
jgi:hypothetical protein